MSLRFGLLIVVALAGCGRSQPDAGTGASQVLARLAGGEITTQQLNTLLASRQAMNADQAMRQQALDSLIDQRLLADYAKQNKLDRSPGVMAELQAAATAVLARAAADQLRSGAGRPTEAEIDAYYDAHPQAFSRRRVYRVDELAIALPASERAALETTIAQARQLDDIAAWLQKQQRVFKRQSGIVKPEDLRSDDALTLQSASVGTIRMLRDGNGSNLKVMQILQITPYPVLRADARAFIETQLTTQRQREFLDSEVASMRAKAAIQYLDQRGSDVAHASSGTVQQRDSAADLDRGVGAFR
jgi:EpsD family peptidyl-prolyl cis-trans isomerase